MTTPNGVLLDLSTIDQDDLDLSALDRICPHWRRHPYPSLSLAQARERCREVRNLVDQGIDPKAELDRRRTSEVLERKAQEQQAPLARATATYEDLARVNIHDGVPEKTGPGVLGAGASGPVGYHFDDQSGFVAVGHIIGICSKPCWPDASAGTESEVVFIARESIIATSWTGRGEVARRGR